MSGGRRAGGLKDLVLRACPPRFVMPLRHAYHRLRGKLDQELRLVPTLVGDRHLAIDIGANQGQYTYSLARWFDRVEAFEPVPASAAVIEAYGAPNVRVHRVALSAQVGRGTLHVPRLEGGWVDSQRASLNPGTTGNAIEVALDTLDHYGFEKISLIKIDVEGHELEVLTGATTTLAQRPVLLIEIEQRHLDYPMHRVFDFLSERGYRGYFVTPRGLRSIREFSAERHQEPFLGRTSTRDYVNDFFFFA